MAEVRESQIVRLVVTQDAGEVRLSQFVRLTVVDDDGAGGLDPDPPASAGFGMLLPHRRNRLVRVE